MHPAVCEVIDMTYYADIKFLSQKDGKGAVRRVIEFLQRDFDEFENQLRNARFPFVKKR